MAHSHHTSHALRRQSQRGIQPDQVDADLSNAANSRHCGGGVKKYWVSHSRRRSLGARTPEGVDTDRLRGLIVLESSDGCVVTNYRSSRPNSFLSRRR